MAVACEEVLKFMEEFSPSKHAYEWDNVGLLLGRRSKEINKIMVALDATEEVVDQAIEQQVDLLMTHHPIIFKGVKSMTEDDFLGRKLLKLIEHKVAVYAAHTNLDAVGSLSDVLAHTLGLNQTQVLDVTEEEQLYKLVVFVPKEAATQVREAMCIKHAGHIGRYSNCTYNLLGEGTFKPLKGTQPYIGEEGRVETVEEVRIETIVKEKQMKQVVQAMLEAHPYEEVAYDLYPVLQKGEKIGIGRVGQLPTQITLEDFAKMVKSKLKVETIRLYGDPNQWVGKVAVSPGKGTSFVKKAIYTKADVLVTGDIDYHTGIDAKQSGIALIDAGHFGTEHIIVDYVIDILKEAFKEKNLEVIKANEERPFITV